MALSPLEWLGLLTFACYAFLPALMSSGQSKRMDMYDQMDQPIKIPRIVFPIVWTTLYALYWISGFLVWQLFESSNTLFYNFGLACYFASQVFNSIWTWLFFVKGWVAVAALDIVLMIGLYIATCAFFFQLRPLAGWLLIPMILWCIFALGLTIVYWVRYGPTIKKTSRK